MNGDGVGGRSVGGDGDGAVEVDIVFHRVVFCGWGLLMRLCTWVIELLRWIVRDVILFLWTSGAGIKVCTRKVDGGE